MFSNIPAKLHINPVSRRLSFGINNKIYFPEYPTKDRKTNSRNKTSSVYFTDKIFRHLLCQRIGTEDHTENQFCTCNPLFFMFMVVLFFLAFVFRTTCIYNQCAFPVTYLLLHKKVLAEEFKMRKFFYFLKLFFNSVTSDESYKIPL